MEPVVPKAATPQVTKADSLSELGVRLHFLEVKANKIYRRLNAVAKMQTYGPQLTETWANARRALWWFPARAQDFSVCFPEMLPSADEIKEICTWLQSTVRSCMKNFHAAAREERSERLLGQERFRFVSKQFTPRQTWVNDSCDVQIVDEQVRQYWEECGRIILSSHSPRWRRPCLKPFRRGHSTYSDHLNHIISELICKSLAEQEELVAGLTGNSLLCLMRPCCRCVNCTRPWTSGGRTGDLVRRRCHTHPQVSGGYWSRRSPAHYGCLHSASYVRADLF